MEQFGWTEKQLYEENTFGRMQYISNYNQVREQVRKEQERANAATSKVRGGTVITDQFK